MLLQRSSSCVPVEVSPPQRAITLCHSVPACWPVTLQPKRFLQFDPAHPCLTSLGILGDWLQVTPLLDAQDPCLRGRDVCMSPTHLLPCASSRLQMTSNTWCVGLSRADAEQEEPLMHPHVESPDSSLLWPQIVSHVLWLQGLAQHCQSE